MSYSSPSPSKASRYIFAGGFLVFFVGIIILNRSMLGCGITLLISGPIVASAAIPSQATPVRVGMAALGVLIIIMGGVAIWAFEKIN